MTPRTLSRKIASALALAVVSTPLILSSASAAPADFGNIDSDRNGSLTVHKFLHQEGDVTGDISEAPADGDFTDPLLGVGFTAYPLLKGGATVDVTVPSAWNDLADLTPGAACTAPTGYTLDMDNAIALPLTDEDGMATAALDLGVYQVCETTTPAGIVDIAAPFILTVPMPHEDGWVYDVHAYPKNGETTVEKTIVAQEGFGLGAAVQFPVSNTIPNMTATTWTAYAMRDTLDERLTPNPANDGVASVTVDGASLDASYYTAAIDGQTITMTFTKAGLDWLNLTPNQAGKTITVTFDSTITKIGDGTITNEAQLWVNNPDFDEDGTTPPIPSNEVKTYWGSAEILKRAAGTEGTTGLLEGAQFEIYNTVDPYATSCDAAEATGSAIAIDGQSVFTSDDEGVISFAGLFVSDSENPAIDATQRCYVIREIAAPAGYVLPSDADTAITVQVGATTTEDHPEILNTQQEVPELPLTGAAGKVLLALGGIAAGLLMFGLMLINRRRSHTA